MLIASSRVAALRDGCASGINVSGDDPDPLEDGEEKLDDVREGSRSGGGGKKYISRAR